MTSSLEAPAGIRLLVLDVDGTLAPQGALPSPAVIAALRGLHHDGVEIMIATGRPAHAVGDLVGALGLDELWVSTSNGAVTSLAADGDLSIVAVETFDPRPAVAVVQKLDPGVGLVFEEPGEGYRISREVPWMVAQPPHLAVEEVPEQVTFAALASAVLSEDELVRALAGVDAAIMPWECEGFGVVDLSPAHVTKATAALEVARRRGLADAEWAAVGDYVNDIEMLRAAGWGVAMGHAPDAVKAAADAVAPSLAEDGVLAVVRAIRAAG